MGASSRLPMIEERKIAPAGTAKSRLDLPALRSFFRSFVWTSNAMDNRKLSHSMEMFMDPRMAMPRPNSEKESGQSIWIPPLVSKSPTRACCVMAAKHGKLLFRMYRNAGMNISVRIISECVTVRCQWPGMSKSTSEISDRKKIAGKLISVLVIFWRALAKMYPRAKWPTANIGFSPWKNK